MILSYNILFAKYHQTCPQLQNRLYYDFGFKSALIFKFRFQQYILKFFIKI